MPGSESLLSLSRQWLDAVTPFMGQLLLKASLWGVLFACLGFILALLVMWQLQGRGLLRRTPRVWSMAIWLVWPVVLIAGLLCGLAGGALYGMQRDFQQVVTEHVEPALAARMPALRAELLAHLGPLATDGMVTARDLVQPLVKDFLVQPEGDGWLDQLQANAANRIVMEVGARAMSIAMQQALQRLPEMAAASAGKGAQGDLVAFSVKSLLTALAGTGKNLDFSPLDRSVPEMFGDAIRKQIAGQFVSLYIGVGLHLLLVGLLVAGEMLFYFRYWLPRRGGIPAPARAPMV